MFTSKNSNQKAIPFRANEWWHGKAMLMMGLVYFYTLWFGLDFSSFIKVVLPSLATIVGFAAFGYLVNDFFDREADTKANKKNSLVDKPAFVILALFFVSFVFVFLPWLFLPSDKFVFILIGTELSLFLLYSIPLLRLKEKGLWGVLIDALYAHALPALIAAYTYVLVANAAPDLWLIMILFLWQLMAGVRNILLHQKEDQFSDNTSNTTTFASKTNLETVVKIIQKILVLEVLFALILFYTLVRLNVFFLPILLAFVASCTYLLLRYSAQTFLEFLESKWRHYPNVLYEKWLPILFLITLSFSDVWFLGVLFLHSILFNQDYWQKAFQQLHKIYHTIPFSSIFFSIYTPIRRTLSWITNQTIFVSFLLFGVNLKKENCSAMEYLKRKDNRQQS